MIAIPRTTKLARLEENWVSRNIDLTSEECDIMWIIVNSAKPEGHRYSAMHEAAIGH
jgi:diketogulonate reductase-like aldo/keto reductase